MKQRNPWVMFVVILLTAVCFAVGQFKVPPVLPVAMGDLGIGLTQGGLLMSIVAITAIVLALFGGLLTVHFKPKTLALAALVCAILGNCLGLVAPNFGVLLFSRLLEGLGYGMQTAVMPTLISEIFPEDKRRAPMALYSIWVSIGMLFIFNFSNVLIETWGWRSCWGFCAIMFVIITVLFFFVVKEPEGSALGQSGASWAEQRSAIGTEVKNPAVWCLTLVFTIFGLGCAGFTTFAPTFCIQTLGMDPALANTATGFLPIGMLVGGFIMSGILVFYKKSRSMLLIVVTIITGVFFTCCFLLNAQWQIVPFCIIFGIVLQTIPPVTFAVAPESASQPKTVGMALGIATAGDHLGSFVGTIALGAVVEGAGGNWFMAVPLMFIFALVGVIGAIGYHFAMKKRLASKASAE